MDRLVTFTLFALIFIIPFDVGGLEQLAVAHLKSYASR